MYKMRWYVEHKHSYVPESFYGNYYKKVKTTSKKLQYFDPDFGEWIDVPVEVVETDPDK